MPNITIFLALAALLLCGAYLCLRLARMLRWNFHAMRKSTAWFISIAAVCGMMCVIATWGFYTYLVLVLFAGDVIEWLLRFAKKLEPKWQKFWHGGATGLVIALAIFYIGYFNARIIRETRYDIHIPKHADGVEKLRAVLLTDMHLGATIRAKELDKIVARVNALAPDVVLLGGDTYDDQTSRELFEHSLAAWQGITARHGVVFVAGNHEQAFYAGSKMPGFLLQVRQSNIRFLEDEHLLLDGAVYIVGRNDHKLKTGRHGVEQLTRGLDKSRPVIMLDHQPIGLAEAADAGVDLMLCGHTHAGQIWPFGLLVLPLSSNDMIYGHAWFGNMQAVTSSGTGAWKLPMRIGTKSEIVVLDITFKPE